MSGRVSLEKPLLKSGTWFVLRRLDRDDNSVVSLQQASIPAAAGGAQVTEIITNTFGLNTSSVVLKIRNHHGRLIPLNSSIPANSKHTPHVLQVTRFFQHVRPRPRTVPPALINKSLKSRLQAVHWRIQRLSDLLPQIKLRYEEKLTQEVECLEQKLKFLDQRMQVADSHSWRGMLSRAPLW